MIPDVRPPAGAWFNLRTVAGLELGKRLMVQNKNGRPALVWESMDRPPMDGGDDLHGFETYRGSDPVKTAADTNVWVYCQGDMFSKAGRLCVQVYQP